MKKFNIILAFSLIIISVSMSGCGKNKSAADILLKVEENLKTVESMNYNLIFNEKFNIKTNDFNIPYFLKYDLSIDSNKTKNHSIGYLEYSVGEKTNKSQIETYQDIGNENNLFYFKKNDIWYKSEEENKSNYEQEIFKVISKNISNFSVINKNEKINEKECFLIEGSIKEKDILPAIMKDEKIENFSDKEIFISLYVYEKTYLPAKISLKLNGTISDNSQNSELKTSFDEYFIEITYNSFNNSEIIVPEEVLNAFKEEKVISNMETTEKLDTTTSANELKEPELEEKIDSLDIDWRKFQFQYNGINYGFPLNYSTLEKMGYLLKEDEKIKILSAGESITVTAYKGETDTLIINLLNTLPEPKTLSECKITSIDIDTYSLSDIEMSKFLFNNNITLSNNKDEIKEKYGEATEIHDGSALQVMKYKNNNNSIEFYFDPDSLKIIELKIITK